MEQQSGYCAPTPSAAAATGHAVQFSAANRICIACRSRWGLHAKREHCAGKSIFRPRIVSSISNVRYHINRDMPPSKVLPQVCPHKPPWITFHKGVHIPRRRNFWLRKTMCILNNHSKATIVQAGVTKNLCRHRFRLPCRPSSITSSIIPNNITLSSSQLTLLCPWVNHSSLNNNTFSSNKFIRSKSNSSNSHYYRSKLFIPKCRSTTTKNIQIWWRLRICRRRKKLIDKLTNLNPPYHNYQRKLINFLVRLSRSLLRRHRWIIPLSKIIGKEIIAIFYIYRQLILISTSHQQYV